ncbi:MAG: rod-binding protein [Hyphomicrobiales bacterium]
MAVSLPSDLIVDVMRNADPSRRNAAAVRLQSLGTNTNFASTADDLVQMAMEPVGNTGEVLSSNLTASPGMKTHPDEKSNAYRGFEHMVLRNLFEVLLPDEKSGAFGGGPSAGVWRSMAADQLAGVYADAGGVGIARVLAGGSGDSAPRLAAQWPYFTVSSISTIGSEV